MYTISYFSLTINSSIIRFIIWFVHFRLFSILLIIRFSHNFILACLYVIMCWAIAVDAPFEITVSCICGAVRIVDVVGWFFFRLFGKLFFMFKILGCWVVILDCLVMLLACLFLLCTYLYLSLLHLTQILPHLFIS